MLLEQFSYILKLFSVVEVLTLCVASTPTQNLILCDDRCSTKMSKRGNVCLTVSKNRFFLHFLKV